MPIGENLFKSIAGIAKETAKLCLSELTTQMNY